MTAPKKSPAKRLSAAAKRKVEEEARAALAADLADAAKVAAAKEEANGGGAGRRVADPSAPTGGGALTEERIALIARIGALRSEGKKWDAIAEETNLSLSALARIRLIGKREGIAGFTR